MAAFIKSPWFPGLAAILFAVLAISFENEGAYFWGLAGAAAFWAMVDIAGRIFGLGGDES